MGHGSSPPVTQLIPKPKSGRASPALFSPPFSESKNEIIALGCRFSGSPRGRGLPQRPSTVFSWEPEARSWDLLGQLNQNSVSSGVDHGSLYQPTCPTLVSRLSAPPDSIQASHTFPVFQNPKRSCSVHVPHYRTFP